MIKNYWLKQGFFAAIFLFAEIFIFLALMSSKNYIAVAIWILHLWPVAFMIWLLKKKIAEDLNNFNLNFSNNLLKNIKSNLEDIAKENE